jgi:chromosome segregation ATPase
MLFEAEYSNLKDSLTEPTSSRQQSKDEEMEALRRRAERAESLLEKSYREAGVWNSTRQAVEERLAELRLGLHFATPVLTFRSSDQEATSSSLADLESEKKTWLLTKLKWDEERRELCQRVAELERDKEELEETTAPEQSGGLSRFPSVPSLMWRSESLFQHRYPCDHQGERRTCTDRC